VTKPVTGGVQIDGFTATTRVSRMVPGEYTALVTRKAPAQQRMGTDVARVSTRWPTPHQPWNATLWANFLALLGAIILVVGIAAYSVL